MNAPNFVLTTNKRDDVCLRRSKTPCRKKLTETHVCMLLHTTSEILCYALVNMNAAKLVLTAKKRDNMCNLRSKNLVSSKNSRQRLSAFK